MTSIQHYLVGEVPVRMIIQTDQTTVLEAFNRRAGRFETNARYYSMIRRDDTGLVRTVTEQEFDQAVIRLQTPQSA
jgi:repressor of nif and glnA expression